MGFVRRWARRSAVMSAGLVLCGATFDVLNDSVLTRSLRTLLNAVRLGALYKFSSPQTPEELSMLHERAASLLLETCLRNEGLYIKLGQGMSAVNHLLPEEYTEKLKVLLDRAPVVPIADVRRIFQEETGKDEFHELFVEFDETPVASASIAQVHKAKLRQPDGSLVDVAVKIQKPNIRRQIWWDLQCYFLVCRGLQYAFDLPLMWSAQCVADNLTKEVDFCNEASNAERVRQDLQGRQDVYIPQIMRGRLLTPRLMVSEWIEGVKLLDREAVAREFSPHDVLHTVLEVFGEMIFVHGFVHCDPHPANVLVRRHPAGSAAATSFRGCAPQHQVVLLDFGLCIAEPEAFRLQYALMFKSIFTGDRSTLVRIVKRWGIGNADTFAALTLQKPYDSSRPVHTAPVTKRDVLRMEEMMKAHVKQLLEHEELVPRELVFVGRSMNLLRGLNKSYGAPVNRVNVFALCAVRGLREHSTWEDVQLHLESHAPASSTGPAAPMAPQKEGTTARVTEQRTRPSSVEQWIRRVVLPRYHYLHFHAALFCLSVVHQATWWFNLILEAVMPTRWLTYFHVTNLEEHLELQEEQFAQQLKGSLSSRHASFHPPIRISAND